MDSHFLNELRERTRALVQKSQNSQKTLQYLRKDFAKRLDPLLSEAPNPWRRPQDRGASKNLVPPPAPKVAVMEMKGKGKAVVPAAECCKGQRRDGGKQLHGGHALSWRPRGIVPSPLQPPSKSFIRDAGRRAGCVPFDPGGPSNNVTTDQLTEMNSPVRVSTTSGPNSGHASSWHRTGDCGVGTGMKSLAGQRSKQTLTVLNRKQVKEYMPKKMQLHTEYAEPNSRIVFHESGNGVSAPDNSLKVGHQRYAAAAGWCEHREYVMLELSGPRIRLDGWRASLVTEATPTLPSFSLRD